MSKYNALDQLFEETVTGGDNAGVWDFVYDLNGALKQKQLRSTVVDRTNYDYDLQGRLSETTYARPGGGFSGLATTHTRYAYNHENIRAQSVTHDGFQYNSGTLTSTLYLIDAHNPTGYAQALEERTRITSVPSTLSAAQALALALPTELPTVSYAYGLQIIEQRTGTTLGTAAYFLTDHQGTTRQLGGESFGVNVTFWFDAYGNLVDPTGAPLDASAAGTAHLFAMLVFDPASELHYALARFLDTGSGRFVSQDPYEGSLQSPLTLPRYWYAGADPLDNVDPNGRLMIRDDLMLLGDGDPLVAAVLNSAFRINIIAEPESSDRLASWLGLGYVVPFKTLWVTGSPFGNGEFSYSTISRAFDHSSTFKSGVINKALNLSNQSELREYAEMKLAQQTASSGIVRFWAVDMDVTKGEPFELSDHDTLSFALGFVDHVEVLHRVNVMWDNSTNEASYDIDSLYFWRDTLDWRSPGQFEGPPMGWKERIGRYFESLVLNTIFDGILDNEYEFTIMYPRSEPTVQLK